MIDAALQSSNARYVLLFDSFVFAVVELPRGVTPNFRSSSSGDSQDIRLTKQAYQGSARSSLAGHLKGHLLWPPLTASTILWPDAFTGFFATPPDAALTNAPY